jgi:hypothetical protein
MREAHFSTQQYTFLARFRRATSQSEGLGKRCPAGSAINNLIVSIFKEYKYSLRIR